MSNYYTPQHQNDDDDFDDAENDSLWDELSHEQSREIQQHQNQQQQHQNQYPNATTPPPSTARTGFGAGIKVGPWNVDSNKIKHTFQETAAKVASVAKTAAQSAQQRVHSAIESNWDSDNHSEGSNSYNGPYAKYNNRTGCRHGHGHGGAYSNNDNQSPFEDFGLRESLEGLDGLHLGYANGESHHTVASKPLLENNYGMDAELGIGHLDGDNGNSSSGQTRSAASNSNGSSNNNPNRDRKFVLLETFGVRKDGSGTVANLDLFFTSLYNYYYHRGLVPIIGKGVVELISLFFTLWLSVFLFVYLDWYGLWECRDEESCRANLGAYIIDNPLTTVSFWNFLMMLYILLFSAYGIFSVSTFITNIKDAFEAKYIFEDKLGISARKLEGGAVEWHEIVKKILELQQSGEYRIAIHGQDIKDELVVAQRILRRENFMIAFFNNDVFDLTIPLKLPWKRGVNANANARSTMKFYSKSLEWSIYFCVLSYMFNHKYQIRPTFCMDAISLQRRFIFCGVAHIVFMPFLLFFMMMHFFLQNVYDFRSSKQYLGPREWSNVAKWTFREFNELPHVFERRLEPSYEAAEVYLKLFAPSSLLNSIGRILVFLSGSLGAVCVALAAVNDAILLHVKIGNWNLLWYVGMLGVAYSIGKSMLPDNTVIPKYHHNLFAEMDATLVKVSNHTHYYPEFWKKRGWDDIIKGEFSELFQYKVKLFLLEIVSIIVAPIILCHSLPPRAIDICSFVQKAKTEVPGSGDHCGFATFDFELFEDENWEGQQSNEDYSTNGPVGGASIMNANRSAFNSRITSLQKPKAKMGKMEKSFFNFKVEHPGWKCASSGQDLVNKIESYKNEQAVALARERQHHIAAATRQLERLRELEEYSDVTDGPHLEQNQINEHYVKVDTYLQSGADIDPATIETPMDVVKEERNNLRVHFKDLPPTPSSATRTMSKSNVPALASVLHYDDIGLSAELNSLLNKSTFDPGASLLLPDESFPSLSFLGHPQHNSHLGEDEMTREEVLQRQYMLLDKYHSQLNSQHEGSGSL